jgi:hypothetical protein
MIFTPYLKQLTQGENYLRKVQTCKND